MNPKIIKADRYKKTTSKEAKIKKDRLFKERKYKEDRFVTSGNSKIKASRHRKKRNQANALKIVACIIVLFLIGVISKKIVKLDNIPIIKAFFNDDDKEFVKNYDLKIGIYNTNNENNSDIKLSKNITISELARLSNLTLVSYYEDYKINNVLAEKITTEDNQSFLIEINKEYKVSAENVKKCIESIINLGDASIYYENVKNISNIDVIDENTLNIRLKDKNPYFVYSLNFPLFDINNKSGSIFSLEQASSDNINFKSNENGKNIESINLKNYTNDSSLVDDFRNQSIDMFTTTSESTVNLIGKYEYSIKKVRNGESIFLLGNKDSDLFSRKEVRQAIAYSLNREELIKSISNSFGEIIDLPYIYSNISYKYDTYAATNALLARGWKKAGGVYTLYDNNKRMDLVLNVLVNKDDSTKVKLSEDLKEMLEKNSIKLELQLLSQDEINEKIKNKEYDLVIANVNMNENPDITYIKEYININNNIKYAMDDVENNTDVELLNEKIANLQNVLSEEIACIGICAYDTDVIYQKYIVGFDDLKYLNIFNKFTSLGRVQKID